MLFRSELVRQAVFTQRVADPAVEIELVEPVFGASLVCDGRMVGQALANVLKNAGEAISARRDEPANHGGKMIVAMKVVGQELAISVEDNGVGLPARDRDRLTEPYVTTREKGTGLGLAIVKRILEDHGGELTLSDAISLSGARATLTFPGATAAPTISARAEVPIA